MNVKKVYSTDRPGENGSFVFKVAFGGMNKVVVTKPIAKLIVVTFI